jgi:F0F1-type ATP synthase assembly protein I
LSKGQPNNNERRRSRTAQIAQAYRTAHEVVSAAISLGFLIFGGYWLDKRYGWSPVVTICGACLGLIVAGASLRQLLQRLDRESAEVKRKAAQAREARSE